MKHFTINMTLAVAALTLAAGTVSAQTMKAEIPFAFRAGGQLMLPGTYLISTAPSTTGANLIEIYDLAGKRPAIVNPMAHTDVPKSWGAPKIQFVCYEGNCALNSLWMGSGRDALVFHSERGKNGEPRIAEITLRPERSGD